MDKVLEGQACFSNTYICDVLILSNTWEVHVEHIRGVLGAFGQAGMTANSAKCEWGANVFTYLGYEVGLGKIKVPEAGSRLLDAMKGLTPRRVMCISWYHPQLPEVCPRLCQKGWATV